MFAKIKSNSALHLLRYETDGSVKSLFILIECNTLRISCAPFNYFLQEITVRIFPPLFPAVIN